MKRFKNLKVKIIAICAACTILVGVLSNLYLYRYLNNIITEKADNIEKLNLTTIRNQLAVPLEELTTLGYACANDFYVARSTSLTTLATSSQKNMSIEASNQLKTYLESQTIRPYINYLIAFNDTGVDIRPVTRMENIPSDIARVKELPIFSQLPLLKQKNNLRQLIGVSPSIKNGAPCIALLSPVYNNYTSTENGWLYIEMNLNWVDNVLAPFLPNEYAFVDSGGELLSSHPLPFEPEKPLSSFTDGEHIKNNGQVYQITHMPLEFERSNIVWLNHFSVYSLYNITHLANDRTPAIFVLLVVVLTSLVVALILAFVLSGIITRPIGRLTNRLKKVSANDFSYDAQIEQGSDEIAEMGKVINEMTVSISHLLKETEDMYIQRKNTEIALLQSQINPHFLYNTLDSIRWMAVIQKNTGIVNMTRSLSNLLRNLAKGVGDKVTLEEELALLHDYVEIQSIRYVGTFEFTDNVKEKFLQYNIIKFTLQPLVENAIFHGIEPTGRYGTVTVEAEEEEDALLIHITDDGTGMEQEEMEQILHTVSENRSSSLSGIGVANVHKRLQLHYGNNYGLVYQSELGAYTRVTVRIPKEKSSNV